MQKKPTSFNAFLFFAGLFVFFWPNLSFSADSVSTTGAQFLEIPAGVRGAAMGGTFTAIADDVSTTYWNTAGLAQLQNIELNLLYVSYLSSINYDFAGFALPLQPGSTIGLSASFDYVPSFNSTNNPSATPGSANDLAIALGYGQAFGDNFALGIGGKFLSSTLVNYSATGEGIDAGLLVYTKGKDWTLGLSVQNLGQLSNFSQFSAQEQLPLIYRAGLAYRFQPQKPTHFLIGVDFEQPINSDPLIHTGGEFVLGNHDFSMALRGGYSFDPSNQDLGGITGASFGAGLQYNEFELDYALVPFGILGDTQRFALTYRFGVGASNQTAQSQKIVAMDIKPQIMDSAGTLKQATFDLKTQARTDIKNWSLQITDPNGNVLRSYTGKGVPPKQIAWDGRDSNGNIVNGGIFANYNFRTVDARGQQVVASDPIFKIAKISPREAPLLAAAAAQPKVFVSAAAPETLQPVVSSGMVKIPGVPFPENNYRLSAGISNYLDQIAELIRKHPNCRVYIEGHSFDEGNQREELILSQNRADAVFRYLVEKGKVSPDNLYSRGHGASAPVDKEDTEEARAKNRRVDIVIITK
jgi:outer membrane protein OmpA-like peptidoglycan-associated protein